MITSKTIPSFWQCYRELPDPVREAAQKAFQNWKENPFHPSLRFKCVESKTHVWAIRITIGYRALCVYEGDTATWFWVGSHAAYDKLIR
jgi:hypothetical protein